MTFIMIYRIKDSCLTEFFKSWKCPLSKQTPISQTKHKHCLEGKPSVWTPSELAPHVTEEALPCSSRSDSPRSPLMQSSSCLPDTQIIFVFYSSHQKDLVQFSQQTTAGCRKQREKKITHTHVYRHKVKMLYCGVSEILLK